VEPPPLAGVSPTRLVFALAASRLDASILFPLFFPSGSGLVLFLFLPRLLSAFFVPLKLGGGFSLSPLSQLALPQPRPPSPFRVSLWTFLVANDIECSPEAYLQLCSSTHGFPSVAVLLFSHRADMIPSLHHTHSASPIVVL